MSATGLNIYHYIFPQTFYLPHKLFGQAVFKAECDNGNHLACGFDVLAVSLEKKRVTEKFTAH